MSHFSRFCPGLLATILPLLLVVGCDRNVGPVPPDRHPDSAYIIRIERAVTDVALPRRGVLFYGARPASGGPPVYVARREEPFFPATYYLTDDNLMTMRQAPDMPLIVFARLDSDGDASTVSPTDWAGEASEAVPPGNREVQVWLQPIDATATDTPRWQLEVRIDPGPQRPDAGMTTYVLLRQQGVPMPLAAARYAGLSFPNTVTLTERELMRELPDGIPLEVVVKVDRDANPQTTDPGDQVGVASVEGSSVLVQLRPDERATP